MKIGDLVQSNRSGVRAGWLGLVMEEEKYEGEVGTWVWYFEDEDSWHWYSWHERYDVDVINESG